MTTNYILVVDDNPINLKLVKVLLSTEGYNVLTAQEAEQAVKILENNQIDLILMDLQMPGKDGFELTQELKSTAQFQHLPIIAITAYAMKGDEEKALAAGCDGYITKPIDSHQLLEIVSFFLKQDKLQEHVQ